MIIITGHGNFATGLKSSLDLIVGNYDFIEAVDFTEEKSPEYLKKEIIDLIKKSKNKVYIFTDLAGGTPFKVSSELTLDFVNVEVLCGTNLPMLVESTMMESLGCEVDIDLIKEAGINSIKPKTTKIEFVEDGI